MNGCLSECADSISPLRARHLIAVPSFTEEITKAKVIIFKLDYVNCNCMEIHMMFKFMAAPVGFVVYTRRIHATLL